MSVVFRGQWSAAQDSTMQAGLTATKIARYWARLHSPNSGELGYGAAAGYWEMDRDEA